MRSPRVLLTAAVCLLLLFAVPTVAGQEDSPTDEIVIEPTDESVATIEDGEIKIAVDVVPHAKSTVEEAFRIRSTGSEVQRIWVSSDVDGVEFHRSDTGDPIERVTLNPGESIGVGLTVDSSRDLDGEFFTIRVQSDTEQPIESDGGEPVGYDDGSQSISATAVTIEPRTIQANETAKITATVENKGTTTKTQTVGLEVDGTIVAQRDVRLGPGDTKQVIFERTFGQVGEFDIAISTLGGETVSRTSPLRLSISPPSEGPVFAVTDGSVSATQITPGESIDATATIANSGDQPGTFTAELAINGVVYQTQTVEIAPGEETTVTFTQSFPSKGTYRVGISDTTAGEISVGTTEEEGWITNSQYVRTSVTETAGLMILVVAVAIGRRRLIQLIR
jgi:uncharacterized membrane protein